MRIGLALTAVAMAAAVASAANLIADGEIETRELPAECRLLPGGTEAKIENFEEDRTWNRCLKVTVVKNGRTAGGKEHTGVAVAWGGTAKDPGFAVVADRKYRFSFEARGTVAQAVSKVAFVHADGKVEEVVTDIALFSVAKDWTQYRGAFVVPKGVSKAYLVFRLYANFERYPGGVYPFPEGSCLMLDKLAVEPVSAGREIWPARAIVLEGANVRANGFAAYSLSRRPATPDSTLGVAEQADGLRFVVQMPGAQPDLAKGGDVWTGDSAELFVCRNGAKGDPLHYVIGPDGSTWSAETNPADAPCRMSASVKDGTTWRAVFDLTWKALGFEARPPKGTAIRFLVLRNTKSADRGRSAEAHAACITCFGFIGKETMDVSRYPVLYVGRPEGLAEGQDPSAFYLAGEEAKERARLEKLNSRKLIVAQMPVTLDPSVPFLPDELMEPGEKLAVRAAINERASLPVAVANMTEKFEEYRVQLLRGWEQVEWCSFGKLVPGLRRADGKAIGLDRIALRRGVRFRDSEAKGRGARLDVLATLDAASAVPVPPKEAGLLWIDVDCTGVEPGVYRGELVVTPLVSGAFGKLTRKDIGGVVRCPVVDDDSVVLPVELEVLPFAIDKADMGFCGYAAPYSTSEVDILNEIGGVANLVTPYGFTFTCDETGHITSRTFNPIMRRALLQMRDRMNKLGSCPRVMIGYAWYHNFRNVQAPRAKLKLGSEAYWRAYREWTQGLADEMRAAGFGFDDYVVEVLDEPIQPGAGWHEEAVEAYRQTRLAVPKMRLAVTEGEREYFEDLFPYVDLWIFKFFCYGDPTIEGYAKRMRDAGKEVSMYACYTSPRQNADRYYRQLVWKAAAWGAKFVSLYELFDHYHVSYEATLRSETSGAVAYWTDNGALPSIRLRALEAGLNDIRWLRHLEKLAAKSSDAALAAEAKAFVGKSIDDVTRVSQHDPTASERFRTKCAELILKLQTGKVGGR